MRLFAGIRIPKVLSSQLAEISRKLALKDKSARVVAVENLHITLQFFGVVDDLALPEIEDALRVVSAGFSPFSAVMSGIGCFPGVKDIRVLWVGIDSGDTLKRLNLGIRKSVPLPGRTPEKRFKEHVTIARFKASPNIGYIEKIIARHAGRELGRFRVEEFELIESVLKSSGPVYNTVKRFPLEGLNG